MFLYIVDRPLDDSGCLHTSPLPRPKMLFGVFPVAKLSLTNFIWNRLYFFIKNISQFRQQPRNAGPKRGSKVTPQTQNPFITIRYKMTIGSSVAATPKMAH